MCVQSALKGSPAGDSLLSKNVKRLSKREFQALLLLSAGMKRADAAEYMEISVNSYRVYLENVVKKLRARNLNHAVYLATLQGLIKFPDLPLPKR